MTEDGERLVRAARAYYEEWDCDCIAKPHNGMTYESWLAAHMAVALFCREMSRAIGRRERRRT